MTQPNSLYETKQTKLQQVIELFTPYVTAELLSFKSFQIVFYEQKSNLLKKCSMDT